MQHLEIINIPYYENKSQELHIILIDTENNLRKCNTDL